MSRSHPRRGALYIACYSPKWPRSWTWPLVAQYLELRDGLTGPHCAIERLYACFQFNQPFDRHEAEQRWRYSIVAALTGAAEGEPR